VKVQAKVGEVGGTTEVVSGSGNTFFTGRLVNVE
jgi:hypothetical protein